MGVHLWERGAQVRDMHREEMQGLGRGGDVAQGGVGSGVPSGSLQVLDQDRAERRDVSQRGRES